MSAKQIIAVVVMCAALVLGLVSKIPVWDAALVGVLALAVALPRS